MRRKIIIGFIAFSVLILGNVLYIVFHLEKTSSQLQSLVQSHQVEILRRNLLEKLQIVHYDFYLINTRYAKKINTIVSDVGEMQRYADQCLGCHHSPGTERKLQEVRNHIEEYKSKISRILTMRANLSRSQEEERDAYLHGQQLVAMVNSMIARASAGLAETTKRSLKNLEKTRMILYLLLLTVPILSVIFSLIMIPNITKPLQVLLKAIQSLKTGNLNFRIKAPLKDEFGEIASAFNEVTQTLKEHIQEMQRTEQMAACGQIAAGLAHEIKNPLAGIKVAVEVLSDESNLAPEYQDTLSKVIAEIKRIELLIKSLLDFARPPKPQFMKVDLNSLLEASLAFMTKNSNNSRAHSRPIEIVKDLKYDLPEIHADPQQVRQVLINLLLNAKEAMPHGGTIRVRTNQNSAGEVEVSISDTGRGISQETMDKIFQPFFTTKPKGTGLGLAISKQLVEQQGGSITVKNNSGGGADFNIRIPLNPPEKHAV